MQALKNGYRGFSLLIDLNWDRIIALLALMAALFIGAWISQQTGALPTVYRI